MATCAPDAGSCLMPFAAIWSSSRLMRSPTGSQARCNLTAPWRSSHSRGRGCHLFHGYELHVPPSRPKAPRWLPSGVRRLSAIAASIASITPLQGFGGSFLLAVGYQLLDLQTGQVGPDQVSYGPGTGPPAAPTSATACRRSAPSRSPAVPCWRSQTRRPPRGSARRSRAGSRARRPVTGCSPGDRRRCLR